MSASLPWHGSRWQSVIKRSLATTSTNSRRREAMLIGVGHPCRPGEKKTQRPTLVSSLTQVMQQPRDHGLAAGVHCHLSEKWPRSYMLNFVDPRDAKIEVDNDKACETLAIGTQGFWQERPAWTWHDRPWSWFCQSEAQGHVRNPR